MKKGGGILAILAGGGPGKAKKRDEEDDVDELDDDMDDEPEEDDLDDYDDEGDAVDDERREVCDRVFDAVEQRDHAAFWSALGDAVDLMRGG